MKRILITSTVVALGLGTQVYAGTFAERIEGAMLAQGYEDIEIELVDGELKVEGKKDGMEIETVYLVATEEVLSENVEPDDELEDDDDDDDVDDETSDVEDAAQAGDAGGTDGG